MLDFIEPWRWNQFKTETEAQLREKVGRLRPAVMSGGDHSGKMSAVKHFYGERRPVRIARRHQDTPYQDMALERRSIVGQSFGDAHLFDDEDDLVLNIGLESPVRDAILHGMDYNEDAEIVRGMLRGARAGESGESLVEFPDEQRLDVDDDPAIGPGAPLTHEGLRWLVSCFEENRVDPSEPGNELHMIISPTEKRMLFGENQTTSSDFRDGSSPIKSYKLPDMYGLNLHVYSNIFFEELGLLDRNAGKRTLVAWAKSGVYIGDWRKTKISLVQSERKMHNYSLLIKKTFGVTRLQEPKVFTLTVTDMSMKPAGN